MYELDGILYAGKPSEMIKVISAKAIPNYQLFITFSTGEKKVYDASKLLDLPVFRPLKDVKVFCAFQIDFDTVTWCDGEIDIAPETLYQDGVPIHNNQKHKLAVR